MAVEDMSALQTEPASKSGWVLVLVREQRLRHLLLVVLGRVGYSVLGCPTLADARQIWAQRSAPSLLLFDGAEASEAALGEQIQQIETALPPEARCRLMVFSLAHPQPRLRTLPGVDALLARPFDLTNLLDTIDALMQTP